MGKIIKDERANNGVLNPTKKTNDRVTRISLKTGAELRCSGRKAVPAPLVASVV